MRMIPPEAGQDDSPIIAGGRIPGEPIPGAPCGSAFFLTAPEPSPIPVLIAAPHGGRAYPRKLLDHLRHPDAAMLRLEDRYVDLLAGAVARETGAALLVAQAPRAMIDLNRAADDVDWGMFGARPQRRDSYTPAPRAHGSAEPGVLLSARRARSGLGLIPRRLPGIGELWKRRHDHADLAARITGIHEPYHACLGSALRRLRARWGAALLIDLHSMPPLPPQGGQAGAEFVLGDRFGASCHGGLIAAAFGYFAQGARRAAHNRPYAGGYVLDRHAAPGRGLHAMQLEIDRALYLDSRLAEQSDGFAPMVGFLVGLVRRLAGEVAATARTPGEAIGADWAEAAE